MDEGVEVVTYFLSASDLAQTRACADQIRALKTSQNSTMFRMTYHRIAYVPGEPTAMIRKMPTNLGLTSLPNVSLVNQAKLLQLDVFPLETDVISLERPDAVREITDVEGTPSSTITACARSIMKIQDVVGKIPRIQAYGPVGEEIVRKLFDLTVDEYLVSTSNDDDEYYNDGDEPADVEPAGGGTAAVSAMLILDRRVDNVTPMLTPLTYEGLLDDVVGIDCGFISCDVNVINPPEDDDIGAGDDTSGGEKKKERKSKKNKARGSVGDDDNILKEDGDGSDDVVALGLNGSDRLYAEVRDQHVEKFGQFLQNQAKALAETHANFTSQGRKKDLTEIHQFVKQIPIFTQNLRSLTNHIHLAELVKRTSEGTAFRERWQLERSVLEGETCYDQIEELVAMQYPPLRLLRLLCLQSVCSGGIKSSRYDTIRRDIVQTYGYEYLFVIHNLEKAGLLSRREGLWMDTASPFNNLRKSLILINAEVDTVEPDDISYVSSGYAPLSLRLIQTAMKGWIGREDMLKEGVGRLIDVTQQNPPEDLAEALKRPVACSLGQLAKSASAATAASANLGDSASSSSNAKKPVLLVFYVGGVTYMELCRVALAIEATEE